MEVSSEDASVIRGAVTTGTVGRGVEFVRVQGARGLNRGVKANHAVALAQAGRLEWWVDGRTGVLVPGSILLKQPGQVHRDLRRDGPCSYQILAFEAELVDAACDALGIARGARLSTAQVPPGDERAAPLVRLHSLAYEGGDRFTVESAIADAATAYASYMDDARAAAGSRERDGDRRLRSNVRRARDFLLAHLAEPVTLDVLADHARTDKFHLCRAFSAEVGLPPHAFLTHLRIARARVLLRRGARPSEVAPQIGFCDQSQFHRHFRRILGVTPGEYLRGATTDRRARGAGSDLALRVRSEPAMNFKKAL